jgi:hypothetical protein
MQSVVGRRWFVTAVGAQRRAQPDQIGTQPIEFTAHVEHASILHGNGCVERRHTIIDEGETSTFLRANSLARQILDQMATVSRAERSAGLAGCKRQIRTGHLADQISEAGFW